MAMMKGMMTYKFKIGDAVKCNGIIDKVVGYVRPDEEPFKEGYRYILKEHGTQSEEALSLIVKSVSISDASLQPSDFISSSAYSHYKELYDKNSVKPYLVYMNKLNDVWVSDAYLWMKYNGKQESDFYEVISEVVFYKFLIGGHLGDRPCVFVGERQVGNKMRNT